MSERLRDDEIAYMKTLALNNEADRILDCMVYDALTELQERRKDPWNRDVEALKEYFIKKENAIAVIVRDDEVLCVARWEDVPTLHHDGNQYYETLPIAWLPWEG